MANYKHFVAFSATKNVGEGQTYATEQAKWDAEIAPYIVAGGKYEKTLIFREATHELIKGSISYGLSVADGARITALETYKSQYDAAKALLTDYQKANGYSEITAADSVGGAIGKLEAGLNAVQTEIGVKNTAAADAASNATGLYKEIEDTATATVTKIVAGASEDFDTLKEVADWIKSDTTGAAKMQSNISTLMGDENTEGSVKKAEKDAKDYADGLIEALEGSATNVEAATNADPIKVTVESTNGEVDSVAVAVRTQALATATAEADGLAKAKDAKDYADTKKSEAIAAVVGTDADAKTADTIKGVKALIAENEEAHAGTETDLNTRLETVEGEGEGSIKKAVADAKTELKGGASDTKDSDTIAGAKKYADSLVSGKNVSAEGDSYVGASAANNKVTVATNVKDITVTTGTVPEWNADGSVKTAAVAPTISGVANSLADGAKIAAAIKAYADAAVAQAVAQIENENEWIEL